jgi:hypothetical protein
MLLHANIATTQQRVLFISQNTSQEAPHVVKRPPHPYYTHVSVATASAKSLLSLLLLRSIAMSYLKYEDVLIARCIYAAEVFLAVAV